MSRILLLQVGSTVPGLIPRRGDFDRWFGEGFGTTPMDVVSPHLGEPLPEHGLYAGIAITGASCMVTDEEPWSVAAEEWVGAEAHNGTAVLGVCYGHQLLARALGGEVGWNSRGREIGTVELSLTAEIGEDPLFSDLASPLIVQESHSQSVLVLPPGARRLAFNRHDDNQAFAFGSSAWGMQFHPEFDADIIRGYIEGRNSEIRSEGLDPDTLHAATRDSQAGPTILRRFASLVAGR